MTTIRRALLGAVLSLSLSPSAGAVPRLQAEQALTYLGAHLGEWVWTSLHPGPTGLTPAAWAQAKLNPNAFKAADANHNQHLEAAEWRAWAKVAQSREGQLAWAHQLQEFFAYEDRDHDGQLHLNDLNGRGVPNPHLHGLPLFLGTRLFISREDFDAADHPHDGALGVKEYEALFVRAVRVALHLPAGPT